MHPAILTTIHSRLPLVHIIIMLLVFATGCQLASESLETQPTSVPFTWSEQKQQAQMQLRTRTAEYVPLMTQAIVKDGRITSIEMLFGTPVQGAFRVFYSLPEEEQSLIIEQEVEGIGFWFDATTRQRMTQGFDDTLVGPSEVYQVFETYMLQTDTEIRSDLPISIRLDLFEAEMSIPFPVWKVIYFDYEGGNKIEIWVDAKVADVVKTIRDAF